MLQITKQGNSIVVEGLNHYFYPYNGTLEVPCNSVITVVDEGDIILFRSASNYDVLFSAKIDEITINGQSVTKDNVGEVFGALSNVSSGGGGLTPEQEEKLNNAVQISDYNADKASQTTIDEAQNTEINKLRGDIEGKQDIIQDLNAIREGANLGKTALQEETDPIWTAEKGNYYTKSEVNTSLETKANKTEIPTVPTNVSAFTNDAGYLTEHQSLDNYYTKTEVDTSLEAKANKSEIPTVPTNVSAFTNDAGYLTEHQSLDNYYTKTESDGKYATQVVVNEEIATRIRDIRHVKDAIKTKADKSEIPTVPTNVSAFTNDAGYLTEHQSLDNYYTKTEVNTSLESKADKSEIPSLNGYATEQWVGQQGYLTEHQPLKTINGETIVGSGDIVISGGGEETDPVWTAEKGNYYTKTEVNTSLEAKADKTEIPSLNGYATEQWVGEQGYLTQHQSLDNYYTKTEVNSSLEAKADKTEIPSLNGYATEQWVGQQGYITEETDPTVPSHVKAITEEDIAKWNQGGYDVYQWSFYPYSYATKNVGFTFTKNGSTISGSQGYRVQYKRHSKTGEIDGTYQTASSKSFLFNIPLTDDTIFIVARLDEGDATRLEFSFDVVSNIKGGGITEETDPVWTAEKGNYYTKSEIDGIVGNVNNALSEIING